MGLATLGYIVPEYNKFPGYLSPSQDLKFTDVPNGLAAISKVPMIGWVQILSFAGFIEGKGGLKWDNENPGDIGWKVRSTEILSERQRGWRSIYQTGWEQFPRFPWRGGFKSSSMLRSVRGQQ